MHDRGTRTGPMRHCGTAPIAVAAAAAVAGLGDRRGWLCRRHYATHMLPLPTGPARPHLESPPLDGVDYSLLLGRSCRNLAPLAALHTQCNQLPERQGRPGTVGRLGWQCGSMCVTCAGTPASPSPTEDRPLAAGGDPLGCTCCVPLYVIALPSGLEAVSRCNAIVHGSVVATLTAVSPHARRTGKRQL